jgi:hypothetical protein
MTPESAMYSMLLNVFAIAVGMTCGNTMGLRGHDVSHVAKFSPKQRNFSKSRKRINTFSELGECH